MEIMAWPKLPEPRTRLEIRFVNSLKVGPLNGPPMDGFGQWVATYRQGILFYGLSF